MPIVVADGGERTTLRFAAQYADASNVGAASWAGHVFGPKDARQKFDAIRRHCEQARRPYEAILRTALVGLFLSDSSGALQAKMGQLPPELMGFFEQLPIVGTPEEAVLRVRSLIEAGFQYVFFIILPFDRETLQLTGERVIPALRAG
ncbi:MAG: hypothetical protein ACR2IK_03775 [Chloroflexota bacterium]